MEEKFNINMNGKEYLAYEQWRESKRWHFKISKKQKEILVWFGLSLSSFIGLWILIVAMFPSPVHHTVYTWNGVFMFMGIAAGISWILHGFGFLLVKVN